MSTINKKHFILITTEGALALGLLYWFFIQRTSTLKIFYEIFSPQTVYFSSYAGLGLLSMLFFGLNLALAVTTWNVFKNNTVKHKTSAGFSALLGLLGASCPACGAFLLSALGLGTIVTILPFRGLEFLGGSALFLAATFAFSLRSYKKSLECEECVAPSFQLKTSKINLLLIHAAVWLVILSLIYFLLQKELLV